jgi:hypothetical protein
MLCYRSCLKLSVPFLYWQQKLFTHCSKVVWPPLVLRTRFGELAYLVTKTLVKTSAFLCIADLFLVLVKALNLWSCILCVRGDWCMRFCTCNGLKSCALGTKPPTFITWSHGSMWLVFSKSVAKIKRKRIVQHAQLQEFEDLPDKKSEQWTFRESTILVIKFGCQRLPVTVAIAFDRSSVIFC